MYGCDSCLERCRTLNKVHRNFLSPPPPFFSSPLHPSSPHLFCYSLRNCILISSISSKNTPLGPQFTIYYDLTGLHCRFFSSHLPLPSAVLNLPALQIKRNTLWKSVCNAVCTPLTMILPLFPLTIFNARNPECRATPASATEGEEKPNAAHLLSLRPSYCRRSREGLGMSKNHLKRPRPVCCSRPTAGRAPPPSRSPSPAGTSSAHASAAQSLAHKSLALAGSGRARGCCASSASRASLPWEFSQDIKFTNPELSGLTPHSRADNTGVCRRGPSACPQRVLHPLAAPPAHAQPTHGHDTPPPRAAPGGSFGGWLPGHRRPRPGSRTSLAVYSSPARGAGLPGCRYKVEPREAAGAARPFPRRIPAWGVARAAPGAPRPQSAPHPPSQLFPSVPLPPKKGPYWKHSAY